jgi:hypothetical protein
VRDRVHGQYASNPITCLQPIQWRVAEFMVSMRAIQSHTSRASTVLPFDDVTPKAILPPELPAVKAPANFEMSPAQCERGAVPGGRPCQSVVKKGHRYVRR